MVIFAKTIMRLMVSMAGAWNIACAVDNFKSGNYLLFGLDVMLTIWMASILVDSYRNL